jgi:hypothetical protein
MWPYQIKIKIYYFEKCYEKTTTRNFKEDFLEEGKKLAKTEMLQKINQ